ncbi:MAG: prohibitin family protein, partial [Bacteroidetes bacterium]|nr:prohibitin family protein [Bacteroidota bacterium]
MAQQEEINLKKILPVGIIIMAVIFLIIFWSRMTITIDAGHGGVLFRTFGGGIDTENTYDEGFHFIAPWNKMY